MWGHIYLPFHLCCVCSYSYIFYVCTYVRSFHCTFSLCSPRLVCICYSVLKPGVISCMLKSDVSKPERFRPVLVGVFFKSGLSSFCTELFCVLRLSEVLKAGAVRRHHEEDWSCIHKQPKCRFRWKQSLFVNIAAAWHDSAYSMLCQSEMFRAFALTHSSLLDTGVFLLPTVKSATACCHTR